MFRISFFILSLFTFSIQVYAQKDSSSKTPLTSSSGVNLIVLGTVQDAGSPHMACKKDCCKNLFIHPDPTRKVVSLGVIDNKNQKKYLFDASPDIVTQSKLLKQSCNFETEETPDGIFLTHAHIGHYTGLMYLGKESMNANKVPVYAMPKMKTFLEQNGPWSQLVTKENIIIYPIVDNKAVQLTANISVIPHRVPHRDEYSETVGFTIHGPNKKALFIPDIDKWEKWEKDIIKEIKKVDYAFIDATFFDGVELNTRDISQIPHPFVIESMQLFKNLSKNDKSKIYFIHFNHTNKLLIKNSKEAILLKKLGFNIANYGNIFVL